MQITIKSGKRGRPLTFDTEDTLAQFMRQLPRAKARLQEIRRTTSGERNEAIFGSETSLPKGISASIDVLQDLKAGEQIDYETARMIKENLRQVKQLASKQERVYGKALANALVKQYEADIDYQSKYASKTTQNIYKSLKQNVRKLNPQQQQQFFTSRCYQNVKTNRKEYQRLIAWAEDHFEKTYGQAIKMTAEEAQAYVIKSKQDEYFDEYFS